MAPVFPTLLCLFLTRILGGNGLIVDGQEGTVSTAALHSKGRESTECTERVWSTTEMCTCSPKAPVAFKVHLSHAVTPAADQIIVFDDVQMNLGQAYHVHNGNFVAPRDGIYQFSASICSTAGHYIVLDLVKNGAMIGRILAGDDAYSDCSSETTIVQLTTGDDVYLKHHGSSGDLLQYNPATLNSFTGVFLQAL